MKSKNQRFLDEYKRFEQWTRKTYDMNVYEVANGKNDCKSYAPFAIYRTQLETIRSLRNVLSHVDDRNNNLGMRLITVNQAMIDMETQLFSKIMNNVISVAIPLEKIYYCKMEDSVLDAIKTMKKKTYTHVPILDDNMHIIGVFGENTLLDMASDRKVAIDETTLFLNIWKYISKPNDPRKIYDFVASDKSYAECVSLFTNKITKHVRLDILFITEDGTADSSLQGLISTWDVTSMR